MTFGSSPRSGPSALSHARTRARGKAITVCTVCARGSFAPKPCIDRARGTMRDNGSHSCARQPALFAGKETRSGPSASLDRCAGEPWTARGRHERCSAQQPASGGSARARGHGSGVARVALGALALVAVHCQPGANEERAAPHATRTHPLREAGAPLPSWRETPTKRAIVGFVAQVTEQGGGGFVPPAERVAVFGHLERDVRAGSARGARCTRRGSRRLSRGPRCD